VRVLYLPLEPYRERYTEMLATWTIGRWESKVDLVVVNGERLPASSGEIDTGSVLDAYGRSYWSTTQVAALVALLHKQACTGNDAIYIDDMFTPGYEAIPYILDQLPLAWRPRIFSRNFAQSVDPDDFTHAMRSWMRPYEQMVCNSSTGVFVASSCHAELMSVANFDTMKVHITGLPFDADDVRQRLGKAPQPINQRPKKAIYSSRFDVEKNPHLFLDIVEALHHHTEFVLCTGGAAVRGLPTAVRRLRHFEEFGWIRVERGCTKARYYQELSTSRVQINTALQDFVSNTAIEASTFGTITLAPAYRSFPEALRNNHHQLFVPWSTEDACNKLCALVDNPSRVQDVGWLSRVQDRTLDRTLACMKGQLYPEWWEED